MKTVYRLLALFVLLGAISTETAAADISHLIHSITAVEAKGVGHQQAARAVEQLQAEGATAVLPIIKAMDQANPLAFNWLQGAFESVADSALQSGELSAKELEAFVLDRTHNGRARKLAFDWLTKVDKTAEDRLIPNMLDDPSSPLRREAVAKLIIEAEQAESSKEQEVLLRKALPSAVGRDQVDMIAAKLKKLGQTVDLVKQFGFLTEWYVIGPFDNMEMKAFDVAYPPEKKIDLDAMYEGKLGDVTWQKLVSQEESGEFDLAELTEPHKGAIDYAYTEFNSASDQDVEFRLATANAWKLWVNDELVFAREEYHRGMRFDQYIVRGRIKEGKNKFLLKICQNEQDQHWAQRWAFQFRIVDESGRAVTQAK